MVVVIEPVDVVILTKNSQRLLKDCIESVYENVPVNRLIVVDGHSTDDTERIVENFKEKYGNVVFVQDKGTRATARQKAIGIVRTNWLMFVDSDVIISKDWFSKAQILARDDVGAVWGIEIWSVMQTSRILKFFEQVTMKIFEKRGGTHDLLVRTKAVEGIKLPYQLHNYEDACIKSWISSKGYKVISTYDPYCIHFRPNSVWTIRHFVSMGEDLMYAADHPSLILPYVFHTCVEAY